VYCKEVFHNKTFQYRSTPRIKNLIRQNAMLPINCAACHRTATIRPINYSVDDMLMKNGSAYQFSKKMPLTPELIEEIEQFAEVVYLSIGDDTLDEEDYEESD
jgi:hypothetical protein